MERMMPVVVAFALGAVAASMVQFPSDSWLMANAAASEHKLIEPLDTAVRYTLPADVAGLRVFMR
jgi:hypothetical protein